MEREEMLEKINSFFKQIPKDFSILEEEINVSTQIEYQKYKFKIINEEINQKELFDKKKELFSDKISKDEKKKLLIQLAQIDDVKIFRTIEKFKNDLSDNDNLKDWAILSYQESKMLIESSLLETNQVFISSGLGGRGSKLRYFSVFFSENKEDFTKTQKKVILSEFNSTAEREDSEIEKIDFYKGFATASVLIPFGKEVHIIFQESINLCNELGSFIKQNIIVTNLKRFSEEDIKGILKNEKSISSLTGEETMRKYIEDNLDELDNS